MASLPRAFFARDAEAVAHDLVGKVLARRVGGVVRRARIVETEAYLGPHDLAAHSSRGRTARTQPMWGPPGRAYVYFIYGLFWMLNVVAGQRDGQAVLLRAAQPLGGWQERLAGPALLARAFCVTRADNGCDLVRPDAGGLRILDGPATTVARDRRIGVDYAGPWALEHLRFLEAGNPHVSVPVRSRHGQRGGQKPPPPR